MLAAAETYAGGTEIDAGTLRLGTGGSLASTGVLLMTGGTFDGTTTSLQGDIHDNANVTFNQSTTAATPAR